MSARHWIVLLSVIIAGLGVSIEMELLDVRYHVLMVCCVLLLITCLIVERKANR